MKTKHVASAGLVASLFLAGCGGGDGPQGPTLVAPVYAGAEGVYTGSVSNGLTHLSLVLENGDFYVLYGKTASDKFGVSGFLRGTGTSSNGAFTAPDVRDYAAAAAGVSDAFNGTYVAGVSLKGTVANAGGGTTYTGTALNDTTYSYLNPALLGNIAGAWTMADLTGAKVALTIAADGKFTGNAGTCTVSGALTPRASGKNVFDFSLVYGGAPCVLAGQSFSGAAVEYLINNTHQLVAAGTDTTRATGIALIGAK